MIKGIAKLIGIIWSAGTRQLVRTTGRKIKKSEAPWLNCPMGPAGNIGPEFYASLAEKENLEILPGNENGLMPSFDLLAGKDFDPSGIHPAIKDFYEHTAAYHLEAWSEASLSTKFFLWALTQTVSRQMNQLNFPISSLELAGGMTSDILPMFEKNGTLKYTGWLRRLAKDGRVIYTGLYRLGKPSNFQNPCVKVSFPLPYGSSTVFLRPEAMPDGSLKLISSGKKFGDPGFYRMVDTSPDFWKVKYMKTLRETFHVYVDPEGVLRTDHVVKYMGFTPLRLHYKMVRKAKV